MNSEWREKVLLATLNLQRPCVSSGVRANPAALSARIAQGHSRFATGQS